MRRWGPFVLLVLAALGLWALYLATDPPPPAAEPSGIEVVTRTETAPGLEGRSDAPHAALPSGEGDAPEATSDVTLEELPRPEDEIERGTCVLHITVVDERGEPMATTIDLWRIDAPATEHYTRGDQLQAEGLSVQRDPPGIEIDELPEGMYRAFLHGLAKTLEDPPSFRVEGARTSIELEMPQRRLRKIALRVLDHEGSQVLEGIRRMHGQSVHAWNDDTRPPWLQPRTLKPAPEGTTWEATGSGGRFGSASGRYGPEPVETTLGTPFAWGSFRDDGRVERRSRSTQFTRKGWSSLRAKLSGSVGHDHTLVGVQVPVEPIARAILLPTGERADKQPKARVRIESNAVLEAALETSTSWLDLPIEISAEVPGYKKLKHTFTLREGWPRSLTLERAPATD